MPNIVGFLVYFAELRQGFVAVSFVYFFSQILTRSKLRRFRVSPPS